MAPESRFARAAASPRTPGRASARATAPKPTMAGTASMPARRGPFLVAADEQRRHAEAPADDEGAHPGGPAELVGGDRDEVGAERREVDRHLAGGGAGVDVDGDAAVPAAGDDLGHRLDRPDLVVGELAVDKDRAALTGEELVERREVDPPEPVDRDRRDRPSPGGREPDRRVLDGGAGDGRGGITLACRPVRPVRRLGPAGGEHDLAGGDVDKVGDGFPGTLDVGGGEATLLVDTTRIGEGARRSHSAIAAAASGRKGLVEAWSR